MKALVGAFNQEKALVGAFSVIVKTGCGTDGAFYSTSFNVSTVQILRSHVMVRVGGGWDTLQNYLDKHDPCRCRRGRS